MTEIFDLLIVFLINTLLFVRIKQTSKTSAETAIQTCSLKYVFLGKNKKVGKALEKNLEGARFW